MTFMKNRKAVSPVIATVILVAVAITVAVGVSYWMGGISSQYTQFEKVEIQTGYASYDSTNTIWTVTMAIKNSGSADATINMVFLNDVPCLAGNYHVSAANVTATQWGASIQSTGVTLKAGESSTIYLYIDSPCSGVSELASLSSGTTVNVKLHSAGGMDYIKLIRLP
ncbi:type IV pilin [Candidatus Bathyarchaeota archaeon]|nr:type IV pilin [Candidatus Bathyarchaeota archaeon]